MTIKELRKEKKLSQAAFAKSIGVRTGAVGAYEAGKFGPSKKTLAKIKGLGKKTAELLIVSLKDHVADDITLLAMDDGPGGSAIIGEDVADAIAALESLGIAKTEAVKRATEAAKHVSGAAEIIAYCLRQN